MARKITTEAEATDAVKAFIAETSIVVPEGKVLFVDEFTRH